MEFEFRVSVSIERESGKFAARDEIVEQIQNELESVAMDTIDGVGADGDSVYQVTEWTVEEQVMPKRTRTRGAPKYEQVNTGGAKVSIDEALNDPITDADL